MALIAWAADGLKINGISLKQLLLTLIGISFGASLFFAVILGVAELVVPMLGRMLGIFFRAGVRYTEGPYDYADYLRDE